MEAAPKGLDPEAIGQSLAGEEGVVEVHDLHVWEVTTGMPAVSAHVLVAPGLDCQQVRWRASRMLADSFGIEHSTLQVEHRHDEEELLQIDESGG
jgi:cobalt-zinc-cadmium efflux system protein